MKGIILCGGFGTRLRPLTETTNKHLLPVASKQMMCYPLKTLKGMGVRDIRIVLGGENIDSFIRFLKDGSQFGLKFTYVYQKEAGGIAQAIELCEDFIGDDNFVEILGDNLFFGSLKQFRDKFEKSNASCGLVLKKVSNPKQFGIARFKNNELVEVVEKPEKPPSNLAVTGLCIFTPKIFDIIHKLKPSSRNELEISEALTILINQEKNVYWETFNGEWYDCGGSHNDLIEAGIAARRFYNDSNI